MNGNGPQKKMAHFGFKQVPVAEKQAHVADVFRSVVNKYDIMNDLMSFGLHRLWKRCALQMLHVRPGHFVLDVASGTGDLALSFAKKVGKQGRVVMSDINDAMLQRGRDRLIDQGHLDQVVYIQADAEHLPFADDAFDFVTIAFGLRNVTDKMAALRSMFRVLKPGGKLLVLEFSHPSQKIIKKLYHYYSFHIIPALGERVANDRPSYQYLVESIQMHPDQEALKNMMVEAGLEEVAYTNLSAGIVAVHTGQKY